MSQVSVQSSKRLSVALLFLSMTSIHSGAAIAKGLFSQVGPFGMVSLRLGLGALILLLVSRPRWRGHTWEDYRLLVMMGLSTGVMNTLLYNAIAYIPVGVAVTLEFVGPLGVALVHSRRGLDWIWVGMAATGVMLLAPVGGIALHPIGVILALMAGCCWAAYIVLAARVSQRFSGIDGLAMSMFAGAIAILPFSVAVEGLNLLRPEILLSGFVVAVLSSALPYSLEITALRRLPVKTFGVLMSLEPAVASCIGLLILDEQLTWRMIAAIVFVCTAGAGSTLQSRLPE
ncbi:EamA family transporter [Oscillatoria sp. CS-180]|uniref:EamA family transporter n=1 Tax=Oscillatoria sp. CS-180 TaxID=3021720 RepID=UPI0023311031|nr:EamA family transporter [Oscillatoria sp. CS-180]MDB9529433.1 EamA family transporter [Oscillatoria sp. CS-180]